MLYKSGVLLLATAIDDHLAIYFTMKIISRFILDVVMHPVRNEMVKLLRYLKLSVLALMISITGVDVKSTLNIR